MCSRSSTMCTSSANLTECTFCTVSSRPLCGASLAFVFTRARRGRGTGVPSFQRTLRTSAPAGIKVLGTSIGSDQFVADKMSERIAKERESFGTLSRLFQISSVRGSFYCRANPRANHTMHTMPPSVSRIYCEAHDEGIWNTAKALMGIQDASDPEHQQLASLPMRMGGLGLRSATRCAGAAYWALWADALPMISDRTPQIAQLVVTSLSSAVPPAVGLAELHGAATVLDQ